MVSTDFIVSVSTDILLVFALKSFCLVKSRVAEPDPVFISEGRIRIRLLYRVGSWPVVLKGRIRK